MLPPQNLTILGSTGSIGKSTLAVARLYPERYRIYALCAHQNAALLYEQCLEFKPPYAVLGSAELAKSLEGRLCVAGVKTRVLYGEKSLEEVSGAPEVHMVMAAIVGAAGLRPTLAAARAGKKILLANKESLVMAGAFFMRTAREHGAQLLPVDSEHNAIFQSLPPGAVHNLKAAGVKKLWLTASGGPFRQFSEEALKKVSPEQALKHPNWSMGPKISVDSASLMNKGLEVIEARWLFDAPPEMIGVVVHPQSVVHSLVEYQDGSFLAQLGAPDMRVPIAHALAYPDRIVSGANRLDLFQAARLDFEAPDVKRFPCLKLAYAALAEGGTKTAVLNAANEIAVEAFLAGRIPFTGIPDLIEKAMAQTPAIPDESLESIGEADFLARATAHKILGH